MILKASKEDIFKINKIGQDLYPNFKNIYKVNEYLLDDNYIILVNKDEFINAFLIVYKNIEYFELQVLIVDKKCRNIGIATNLLKYFFSKNCQKGDIILLEVSSVNENAIRLYEKFGFETINVRKNYYKNSDALVMKKVIE